MTLIPIVFAVVVLATDAWVYWDARAHRDAGDPVEVAIGPLRVETPETWFLGVLVLWVVFFPLYLTATNRNPFTRTGSAER
jgi:hypothetical protein